MDNGQDSHQQAASSATAISERLQQLRGDHPYAYIADLTGTNMESARRHIQGGNPHVDFVVRICIAMHCSAEWLLLGRGPRSLEEAQVHLLEQARPSQLCRALGLALERMEQSLTLESKAPTTTVSSIEAKPASLRATRANTQDLKGRPLNGGDADAMPPNDPPR
jgi:hypothetical protein